MERTPSSTSLFSYCIGWSGTEGSGTEFGDLIPSSIGVWIGMCDRPCSGPFILSGSHICPKGAHNIENNPYEDSTGLRKD